jgi:hypothetical protein
MALPPTSKPAGSGWFSLVLGVAFIVVVVVFALLGKRAKDVVDPDLLLAVWMIGSGAIMGIWGLQRIIRTTAKRNYQIGQETINLCVAIIAVTFTILAIILQK